MLFEALARMKNGMENQMMKKEVKLRVCVWGRVKCRLRKCWTRGCTTRWCRRRSSKDSK